MSQRLISPEWGRIISDGNNLIVSLGDGQSLICDKAVVLNMNIDQTCQEIDVTTRSNGPGMGWSQVRPGLFEMRISVEFLLQAEPQIVNGRIELPKNVDTMTIRELLVAVQDKIKEREIEK